MNNEASRTSEVSHLSTRAKGLLALYLPMVMLVLLVAIASLDPAISVTSLTRDMAAIAKIHPLTGVLSNVGILLWCATAAICLFSSNLLRQQDAHPATVFLSWAGLMSAGLLLDDFFMFHEYLGPIHLGLDEKAIHVFYACVMAAYLLRHRRLILQSNYRLLVAALALFGGSMAVDQAQATGWWHLAEDGCKVLGIASWFGYHAGRARHWLMPVWQQRNLAAPSEP